MIKTQPVNSKSNSYYSGEIIAAFIAVAVISFVVFLPDLRNGFLYTWDDGAYIVYNSNISELTEKTVRWAFTTYYADYWAPLTWLSLALDRAVWGLNPFGYHLTNNILHALNSGMFFLVCLTLLKQHLTARPPETARPSLLTTNGIIHCSILAALFFAVHPLRVESVVWASERKDVLSFFFGISATFFYLRHTEREGDQTRDHCTPPFFFSSGYYWLAVGAYGLSLLSKPMLVTLPVILLILDWFPLNRLQRPVLLRTLLEKVPLIMISGIVVVFTMLAQSSSLVSVKLSPISSRVLIASKAIMSYLWLMVWPTNLNPFSLHPRNIEGMSLEYIIPIFLLLIITAYCALKVKDRPFLMAAWLIYLITLLPVLGLIQGGLTDIADRFTYVPGLPLALLIALGIITLKDRLSRSRSAIIVISVVTVSLLLTVSYLTVRQIAHWKDDVSLWTRAIDAKPHFSGKVYYQRGRSYAAIGEYQKALADINEAYAIASRKKLLEMAPIYVERARILHHLGDINAAIADYTSAISSDTSPSQSMYLLERGKLYREIGRTDLADEDFKKAAGGR